MGGKKRKELAALKRRGRGRTSKTWGRLLCWFQTAGHPHCSGNQDAQSLQLGSIVPHPSCCVIWGTQSCLWIAGTMFLICCLFNSGFFFPPSFLKKKKRRSTNATQLLIWRSWKTPDIFIACARRYPVCSCPCVFSFRLFLKRFTVSPPSSGPGSAKSYFLVPASTCFFLLVEIKETFLIFWFMHSWVGLEFVLVFLEQIDAATNFCGMGCFFALLQWV